MACTTADCVNFLTGVTLLYDPSAPGNYTIDGTSINFGVTPDYLNESRDASAKAGILFMFALAVIISTARLAARLSTGKTGAALGFGWDDMILILTVALYIVFVGLAIPLLEIGTGRHIFWIVMQGMIDQHIVSLQEIWDFTVHLVYTTAMFTCRLSALAFFSRLSSQTTIRRGIWITLAVITAAYLAQMFALIFHCHPVTALWPYDFQVESSSFTCQSWGAIYLVNGVLSFASDMAVFVIPALLVHAYKGTRSDKMKLALVLLPGIL